MPEDVLMQEAPAPQQQCGASISYQPLYGVHGEALCSLLTVNGFTFLLDCGWTEECAPELLEPLKGIAAGVDAVLLSQPDVAHLGALPHAVGQLQLQAPIYATLPVIKMGTMFTYNLFLAHQATSDAPPFTLDEVDAAFEPGRVNALKYLQTIKLKGKGAGLSLTPYAAGHMLGSAIWHITTAGGESIVYAIDFHHRRERHLSSTMMQTLFVRPDVLITGALSQVQRPGAPADRQLLDLVMQTLRGNGNVLIPVDTAGRVVELILLLEHHWAAQRLTYPLALLSPMGHSTLEFAKSQLEWMNDQLVRNFELSRDRENPFALRRSKQVCCPWVAASDQGMSLSALELQLLLDPHCNISNFQDRFMKLCSGWADLAQLPNSPRVVLATGPSLRTGGSRQLFADWAGDRRNLMLFTQRAEAGSLAAQVQAHPAGAPALELQMRISRRVALEGEELEAHLAKQREEAAAQLQKAQQEQQEAADKAAAELAAAEEAAALPAPAERTMRSVSGGMLRHDSGGSGLQSRTSTMTQASLQGEEDDDGADVPETLIDRFQVPQGAAGPMFPFEDESDAEEWDEYGAQLKPQDYGAEGNDVEGAAVGADAAEAAIEAPEPPTKIVTHMQRVTLRARVASVDLEGRSDRGSVARIIAQIAPRQLVLLHGTPQSIQALRQECLRELDRVETQVHTPADGQHLNLSLPQPSWTAQLAPKLLARAALRAVGGYELGWVDGLAVEADAGVTVQSNEGWEAASGGVFIGDLRLSQLKQVLADAGIAADWQGSGVLACAGSVLVRASQSDREIQVEGPLTDDWFRIRELVHGQYHVC